MRVQGLAWGGRIICLLLGLGACAPAPALEPGALPPASLAEGWEARWSQEGERVLEVARQPPGAPGWVPFRLGVPPEGREDRTMAWFHVRLPVGSWPDPALFLESVDTDFELYLDGQLLATHGRLAPPFPSECPGLPWHLVRLPPDFGGKVLTLRVRSPDPLDIGPAGRVKVGARSDLVREVVTEHLDLVLIGLLCICLGGVALVPGVRTREERPLLWFGLYAISRGMVLLSVSDVRLLMWNAPGPWFHLLLLGQMTGPVALWALAHSLFGRGRRWPVWLGRAALGAGLGLWGAGLVNFWGTYPLVWRYLLVAFPAFLLATCWLAVREAWGGQRIARLFLLGFGGYTVGAVHDLLMSYHVLEPGPRWDAWGLLFLVAVLGVLAQGRWREMFWALRAHARELEEKNARLEEAERALQAAVRARDDFLSVASHELKTPLTALLLRVQKLVRSARQHEAAVRDPLLGELEAVRRQAVRLDRLAEDLLDVTRMSSGPPSLQLVPVDLAALVREGVGRAREEAERVGSHVVLTAPEVLTGQWDPMRLEQVVTNLLSNALKYGAGKPVRVELTLRGEVAVLAVADQGVGIAPDAQQRIFERFERAASVRNYPGLGLGLWIVREIVSALGGTIRVESAPGQGSRFVVELPLTPLPTSAASAPALPGPAQPVPPLARAG